MDVDVNVDVMVWRWHRMDGRPVRMGTKKFEGGLNVFLGG